MILLMILFAAFSFNAQASVFNTVPADYSLSTNMGVSPITAASANITSSATITTTSVKIIGANPSRKGLVLYNNSANSIYISYGSPANSNTNMTYILATFASLTIPQPVYTGTIYGIRNAGTGTVLVTELL